MKELPQDLVRVIFALRKVTTAYPLERAIMDGHMQVNSFCQAELMVEMQGSAKLFLDFAISTYAFIKEGDYSCALYYLSAALKARNAFDQLCITQDQRDAVLKTLASLGHAMDYEPLNHGYNPDGLILRKPVLTSKMIAVLLEHGADAAKALPTANSFSGLKALLEKHVHA